MTSLSHCSCHLPSPVLTGWHFELCDWENLRDCPQVHCPCPVGTIRKQAQSVWHFLNSRKEGTGQRNHVGHLRVMVSTSTVESSHERCREAVPQGGEELALGLGQSQLLSPAAAFTWDLKSLCLFESQFPPLQTRDGSTYLLGLL